MNVVMEKRERGTAGFPFQVYRGFAKERARITAAAHYHNELEIMKLQSGNAYLIVDGVRIKTVPNRIYFINPGEIHTVYTYADSEYNSVVFSKELLSFSENSVIYRRLIEPLFSGGLRFCQSTEDAFCCEVFHQLETLACQGERYAPQIVACLLQLLGHCEESEILQKVETPPDWKEPIYRAIRFMENHFTEQLTLAQIAETAGMSPKYFCSYFKKYTGTTAVTYLNTLRIRKAKELLRGGASVLESAFSCGFENISFFIKKFKEANGKTPGQYKKEHRL